MRTRFVALVGAIVMLASTLGLNADVKTQQKTQLKLEGMLGTMAGMFGGKAAKEGIVSTIALKGSRRMMTNDTSAELVDLDAEKVYRLDLRGKTYTVKTFEEMRAEFEKNMAKSRSEAAKGNDKADGKSPEMEFDVDIKKTGERKTVGGAACEQVIMTLTMHEKGKTVDEAGGMIITSDMWMAPTNPALQESLAFEMKYLRKLYGDQAAASGKDLMQAMAMYPGMKNAMERLQTEGRKMDGTPMLTTVTVAGAGAPGESDSKAGRERGGIGGLAGMLGRKKKAEQPAEGAAGGKGRATILTTVSEVLSIESTVAAGDVDIPAGFKQK
ncbi:MAG: hypothetical protein WCP29_00110 [Acidobacteriota bacterium]